ncbi:Uncharacterized protein Rs2_07979 [Raphanus sativus]|nr:Uncharacterized protein Rs2_07979 [Raphanus sativus]
MALRRSKRWAKRLRDTLARRVTQIPSFSRFFLAFVISAKRQKRRVIMSDAGAGTSHGGSQGGGSQGGGSQGEGQQYQPVVNEDDVEDLDGDQPIRKAIKRKNRGPLDKFVMSMPPDILKGRKEMKDDEVEGELEKEDASNASFWKDLELEYEESGSESE